MDMEGAYTREALLKMGNGARMISQKLKKSPFPDQSEQL